MRSSLLLLSSPILQLSKCIRSSAVFNSSTTSKAITNHLNEICINRFLYLCHTETCQCFPEKSNRTLMEPRRLVSVVPHIAQVRYLMQLSSYDCGLAAVSMVLTGLGLYAPITQARQYPRPLAHPARRLRVDHTSCVPAAHVPH